MNKKRSNKHEASINNRRKTVKNKIDVEILHHLEAYSNSTKELEEDFDREYYHGD